MEIKARRMAKAGKEKPIVSGKNDPVLPGGAVCF